MKFAPVRAFALSLPEVTKEPHFQYSSFRVRGNIFMTVAPGEAHIHVFVGEALREPALAMCPHFVEQLCRGGKAPRNLVRRAAPPG